MRRLLLGTLATLALWAPAIEARACLDCGATIGPMQGGGGVVDPSSGTHYAALSLRSGTAVTAIDARGNVIGWSQLRGIWGVPQVANDGSTGGLSGDGRVLVLERVSYRYPQRWSAFAVLAARRLALRTLVRLPGDFTFDAISPDGTRLYLIEHPTPGGLTSYRVRAYDLTRGLLLAKVIADPTEWTQIMHGVAVTRVTSADGSHIYTLYDRGRGRMFVHALDTAAGSARCIDLPRMQGTQMVSLDLSGDGSRLDVQTDGTAVYRINTRSFGIDPVSAPAPAEPVQAAASGSGGDHLLLAAVLGLAAALVSAAAVFLLLRRREATLRVWRPRSG